MKRYSIWAALVLLFVFLTPMAQGEVTSPRELDYAYIRPGQPYMILGKEAVFSVEMSENPDDYVYTWTLYIREDLSKTEIMPVTTVKESKDSRFAVTVDKPAHYIVQAEVMSPDYRTKRLRTGMVVAADQADEKDPMTAVGKVAALNREMNEQNLASDYEKALWFHDWLIFNADYDESMLIHEPGGVLCRASGVCESYALAYQMLLDAAGIPVLYMTGYAGGESHAWNLVKLDNEWYHIDCTWDDPKGGGNEGYGYFGLSDDLMRRDHNWEVQDFIAPKATGTKYNYLVAHGAKEFDTLEKMDGVLSQAAEQKTETFYFYYTGSERYFDAMYEVGKWLKNNMARHLIASYSLQGSRFSGKVTVQYGESKQGALSFETAEQMGQALETAMAARQSPISLHYRGADRYFNLGSTLKKWLSANSRRLYATEYRYSYTDATADIELAYGDFSGYTVFGAQEELTALLDGLAAEKQTAWKLYYAGEDEWYNIGLEINKYLSSHPEIAAQGQYQGYAAELTVQYR